MFYLSLHFDFSSDTVPLKCRVCVCVFLMSFSAFYVLFFICYLSSSDLPCRFLVSKSMLGERGASSVSKSTGRLIQPGLYLVSARCIHTGTNHSRRRLKLDIFFSLCGGLGAEYAQRTRGGDLPGEWRACACKH